MAGFGRAPARSNSFGGVFSGPLVDDRGWFLTRYGGLRLRQPAFLVSEVPGEAMRAHANADVRRFLSAFPVANGGATGNGLAFFRSNTSNPADDDEFTLIADARITDDWRTNLAYSLTRSAAAVRGEAGASASTVATTRNRYDSVRANLDGSVLSTLRINVTGAYSTNRIRRGYQSDNFGGANSLTRNSFAFQRFELPGTTAALMTSDDFAARVRQFVLSENTGFIRNSWFFDFGGDLRHLSFRPGAPITERRILFNPQNSAVNPLAARISEFERTFPRDPSATDFSLFANARYGGSDLSLSFGLRADNERAVVPSALAQNTNSGVNLAPRASVLYFKWDTEFRAGMGLYYDYRTPFLSEFFVTAAPYLNGRSDRLVGLNATPVSVLPTGIGVDPNLRTPRVWHSFGEISRRFGARQRVSTLFSMSRASHQIRTALNTGAVNPGGLARTLTSDGRSESEAIDVTYSMTFELLRIWSRYSLRRTRDDFPADSLRDAVVRSNDPGRDFGASDFDIRHQFSTTVGYRLPFFFTQGWKKRLNEDWIFGANWWIRSGLPMRVGVAEETPFGWQFVRASRVDGVARLVGSGLDRRLNRNAFSLPASGLNGNLRRGDVRGFAFGQLDLEVRRVLRFGSRASLSLSAQIRNATNAVNRVDPRGNLAYRLSDGQLLNDNLFGTSLQTAGTRDFSPFYFYGGPRNTIFSARFSF